jgi:hypothetical protein
VFFLLSSGLLLGVQPDFVEAFAHAPSENAENIRARLTAEFVQLSGVRESLLKRLLRRFYVLCETVLRGTRLSPTAEQSRRLFDSLLHNLSLTLGQGSRAFDCQLISLNKGLDILLLRLNDRFNIETRDAEITEYVRRLTRVRPSHWSPSIKRKVASTEYGYIRALQKRVKGQHCNAVLPIDAVAQVYRPLPCPAKTPRTFVRGGEM